MNAFSIASTNGLSLAASRSAGREVERLLQSLAENYLNRLQAGEQPDRQE